MKISVSIAARCRFYHNIVNTIGAGQLSPGRSAFRARTSIFEVGREKTGKRGQRRRRKPTYPETIRPFRPAIRQREAKERR
jgi:hypothetical protein